MDQVNAAVTPQAHSLIRWRMIFLKLHLLSLTLSLSRWRVRLVAKSFRCFACVVNTRHVRIIARASAGMAHHPRKLRHQIETRQALSVAHRASARDDAAND